MIQKADKKLIKSFNEIRILNLIRKSGPVSRTELAKVTNISKVAVYEIITRLMQAGFVVETGKDTGIKRVGKRPTLIELNSGNHFFIGLEIKRSEARIALADIQARIISTGRVAFKVGSSTDSVLELLFNAIDALLDKENLSPEKLVSIAIGIPGLIDYEKGRLRFADTLRGWRDMPLAEKFEQRYGAVTTIENDVKLVTLGEAISGAGRDSNNLICIWIGEGIGSGLVVDGHIHKGEAGSAGEIGYLEFSEVLAHLPFSKYLFTGQEMLGDVLSEAHFLEVIREHIPGGANFNSLQDLEVTRDAEYGKVFFEILDEYAYYLSIICINFITTLNPQKIIICGHIIERFPYLIDKTQQVVEEKLKKYPFGECNVIAGMLKDKAGLVGAIELALKAVFQSPIAKKARIIEFD